MWNDGSLGGLYFHLVDRACSDALSHSCAKLGNGDFVFKFVERNRRLINKWSVKTSGVSRIEQILQFKACQQDIII